MKLTRRQALQGAAATAVLVGGCKTTPVDPGAQSVAHIEDLRVDYVDRPLGTAATAPLLSWKMRSERRGARQVAYRILVARSEAALSSVDADLWDSGRVDSDRSFAIPYGGAALRSRERAHWRVEVWDEQGTQLQSAGSWWETGLGPDDWQGDWLVAEDAETLAERAIGLNWIWGEEPLASPRRFRWPFTLRERPVEASFFISAKDTLAGLWMDGEPLLRPEPKQWTSWGMFTRLDLTAQLANAGSHVIALEVTTRKDQPRPVFGGAVVGYLRLKYADQRVERLPTGPQWRTTLAPRNSLDDWTQVRFDDAAWNRAQPVREPPECHPWLPAPAVLLRTEFTAKAKPVRARLYATALGAYEASINGRRVDDRKLAPESTDFRSRALYQTYDVTSLVQAGANALGFMVGDGWFASKFSYLDMRYSFGPPPRRLKAQLEIWFEDGSRQIVSTGPQWQIAASPIVASDIYDGETYDARLEQRGWNEVGFSLAAPASVGSTPSCKLDPQISAPIRVSERLRVRSVNEPRPGVRVYDFGQNIAGWAAIKVRGKAGTRLRLRFAEVLKPNGELDVFTLRRAANTDVYILRGEGVETFEPHFTYHGFRYVEVTADAPEGEATWQLDHIEAAVVHSDLAIAGKFRSSDPTIEALWRATLWSQRANFFGVPTDCPQRDERMGWTGDAQIIWDAAAFNQDIAAFTHRFMSDIRAGQLPTGEMPDTAPFWKLGENTPGWADAAAILPWTSWQRYGDTKVIAENWAAMDRWQRRLLELNPDYVWRNSRGLDYGDWLSVDAKSREDITTPRELISTAYWAYSAQLMSQMATAIDRRADSERYAQLAAAIKRAFVTHFVTPETDQMAGPAQNGVRGGTGAAMRIGNGSQTSAVLALKFDLLPPELRPVAIKQLAGDIRRRDTHLSTGFLGTPYILDALAEHGEATLAISLLLQTTFPSWGFMFANGATTPWERWDGIKDGVITGSLNHYALGAVVGFLYRRLAGIDAATPGFERVRIRPLKDARLSAGGGMYEAITGTIATDWRVLDSGAYQLDVALPANTRGEIHIPARGTQTIKEGRRSIDGRADVRLLTRDGQTAVVEVASGQYRFTAE
ncbi:family 78 glycoside hydrolase catalytic domain [Steroidobacter sp. S1-65]|uniref:alpha-L-rhamnosidase n=1 Tax=Steroidobacter gossypii TaxID=2805490 RepID=A0ABS1WUW7_9GAMM|nr:family 78 glycoside hydrolase catalytic domain [Steroidobacter gossypii]MBM0104761.1 family 78 glycoside hydrolase catalytic domain [Steroidobacter gossypii]